jgi:3',5'-cyclic AMP phosphodiesterase CpdA
VIRIAHISDLHFGGENAHAMEAAREHINGADVALAVISGDVTRFGKRFEFAHAAAWLSGLAPPKLITPGNHDAPYFAAHHRLFTPFRRFEETFGPAAEQDHLGDGLAVRGVNTARGAQPRLNWSKGQIARSQVSDALHWFDQAPAGALRAVACHHPLIEITGGPMTARVWGGDWAARAFAEAKVDLVLSGHLHAPFALAYPFGDGLTYAVGAGTLSVRERGAAAGFNMIEIERATIRIVALHWTGSQYEPSLSWSLDRR